MPTTACTGTITEGVNSTHDMAELLPTQTYTFGPFVTSIPGRAQGGRSLIRNVQKQSWDPAAI